MENCGIYDNTNDVYDNIRRNTVSDCKLLYRNPCPWSVGKGWYNTISDFSYKCEELNLRYYRKYRTRIALYDIKQKYGMLRIYGVVELDPNGFVCLLIGCIDRIINKLRCIDYKYEIKTDHKPYKVYDISVMDNNNEDSTSSSFTMTSNINGKTVKTTTIYNGGTSKMVPTKHKFTHFILTAVKKIQSVLRGISIPRSTSEKNVIYNFMNNCLEEMVDKCENDSEHICERCGKGVSNNTACYTTGWISVLCEKCATKCGREYIQDNKIYKGGTYLGDANNDEH